MPVCLSCDERALAENLAYALFPLDQWIEGKRYIPPQDELPWRRLTGAPITDEQAPFIEPLTPARLGVADFFENLFRSSENEGVLINRWETLHEAPLAHCPIADVAKWREARGLGPVTKFGVIESENVLLDRRRGQLARLKILGNGLKALAEVVAMRLPRHDDGTWATLARELLVDECPEWPAGTVEASTFCYQFVSDLLSSMLGGKGPVAEPWRNAVLTEMGEFRRPGNTFTRADVEQATTIFMKRLATAAPARALDPPTSPKVLEHYRNFFGGW